MARSTPGLFWILAAVGVAFGVVFTYSRGATLILGGYFILAAAVYIILRLFSATRSTTSPVIWLALSVMLIGVVGFAASQLTYTKAERTFSSLFTKQAKDVSVAHRLEAYTAASSLLKDHWQRGIGSGGFRYLFPEYIKHYPNSYRNGQLLWEHAHCDWLQLPIELGATGIALVILIPLWIVRAMIRFRLWHHPAMLLLVLASLQTLLQAGFDFPFQNPAVLILWLTLLVLAIRWTELETAQS